MVEQIQKYLPEQTLTRPRRKSWALLTAGVLAGVILGYAIFGDQTVLAPISRPNSNKTSALDKTATGEKKEAAAGVPKIDSTQINVAEQIPGDVVLVKSVAMETAGWVAIHDDAAGLPGNILGAYYLPAGIHEDQQIPLLRSLAEDHSYIAVIHNDNGDKEFDYKTDLPRLDPNNNLLEASFAVAAASPRGD